MIVLRRCVLLVVCVVMIPCAVEAQPSQQAQETQQAGEAQRPVACQTAIPWNIDAGVLAADMLALLHRSETFRAQCGRLAGDARVRVKLDVVTVLDAGRAQTAIRHFTSGALRADVRLLFGENYRELLSHEFEHVIEQADGVNLRQEAASGRAWQLPGGVFETRRAYTIGVQVLRECGELRASAHGVDALR